MHHTTMSKRIEPSPSKEAFQCWKPSEKWSADKLEKTARASQRKILFAKLTTLKVVLARVQDALMSQYAQSHHLSPVEVPVVLDFMLEDIIFKSDTHSTKT